MKVRFLIDENLSNRLKIHLKDINNQIDVIRIGDGGAPPFGTSDPDILFYLSQSQRILITGNRSTIPQHLIDFYEKQGFSHWGVLWVRPDTTIHQLTSDLYLIWEITDSEEWKDRTDWIPF